MPNPKTEVVPDYFANFVFLTFRPISMKHVSVSKVANFAGLIWEPIFRLERD